MKKIDEKDINLQNTDDKVSKCAGGGVEHDYSNHSHWKNGKKIKSWQQ